MGAGAPPRPCSVSSPSPLIRPRPAPRPPWLPRLARPQPSLAPWPRLAHAHLASPAPRRIPRASISASPVPAPPLRTRCARDATLRAAPAPRFCEKAGGFFFLKSRFYKKTGGFFRNRVFVKKPVVFFLKRTRGGGLTRCKKMLLWSKSQVKSYCHGRLHKKTGGFFGLVFLQKRPPEFFPATGRRPPRIAPTKGFAT